MKPTSQYVNNQKLLEELRIYKTKLKEASETGKQKPQISNYIGKCIMQIAENLIRMNGPYGPRFLGYSFKDEMVSDGIENVIQYIDNFDPDKYNNPFAYITKIIYYAFLRRIAKEKKHLYVKYKMAANHGIFDALTNTEPNADGTPFEMFDNLLDYIEEFETKKKEKQKKKR